MDGRLLFKILSRHRRRRSLRPAHESQLQMLIQVLLLEKAIYELKYELNNRPTWVEVPLRGILELLR